MLRLRNYSVRAIENIVYVIIFWLATSLAGSLLFKLLGDNPRHYLKLVMGTVAVVFGLVCAVTFDRYAKRAARL